MPIVYSIRPHNSMKLNDHVGPIIRDNTGIFFHPIPPRDTYRRVWSDHNTDYSTSKSLGVLNGLNHAIAPQWYSFGSQGDISAAMGGLLGPRDLERNYFLLFSLQWPKPNDYASMHILFADCISNDLLRL